MQLFVDERFIATIMTRRREAENKQTIRWPALTRLFYVFGRSELVIVSR